MLHAWVIQGKYQPVMKHIYSTSIMYVKIRLRDIFCTCDWCTMYYVPIIYFYTRCTFRSYPSFTEFWSKSTQRLPSTVVSPTTEGDGLTKEPMQAEDVLSLGSAKDCKGWCDVTNETLSLFSIAWNHGMKLLAFFREALMGFYIQKKLKTFLDWKLENKRITCQKPCFLRGCFFQNQNQTSSRTIML